MDAARQRLTSPEGLAWVRQRVSADPSLSRQRLAREVCEHFGWHDVLGRPKEMACRKYLLQLQRRGLMQLPPARYQAQPRQRRRRAALQDVPQLNGTLADLGSIELQPVRGGTAASRRWNALLEAYHPQGSGPLCGAQLRYLILSATVGEIGGIAVSAAAWRLAARDRWLGWSDATRAANLSGIVCNSRFLILPTICVKHLASHVLGLLTRRIVPDWQRRYGISPWLLETCVELERIGTSYRAANWVEVGLTAGRGRQDRLHKEDVPQKRVFLYPLCKTTLERLCGDRAAPEPGWVHQEFAGAELGDCRLQQRLFELAEAFLAHPTATIAKSLSTAGAKAAYRFFDHADTTLMALLKPHRLSTLARMRREGVVLVVQDTWSLDCEAEVANVLSDPSSAGLRLCASLAFSAQGLPLGILAAAVLDSGTQHEGWAPICEAQHRCPKSRIVTVEDCEGDNFAFFEEARRGFEVFQAILASGCRIRRLASLKRLEACLAIDMVVAWRMHYLASSGRSAPENSDAQRKISATGPAHRRTADPEPLHRAHGA